MVALLPEDAVFSGRAGGGGGGQKSQKSMFSDLETITIESGVVDLVGQFQLGIKFMNLTGFFTKYDFFDV